MINYWLVRLGKKNTFAEEAFKGNFIGVNFGFDFDLGEKITESWRDFNDEMIPIFLKNHPDKKKVSAGLACGNLWTVIKGIKRGDIVLCPIGNREYRVAEVGSDYKFVGDSPLPHQRDVVWKGVINRDDMSETLSNSAGSIMTAFSLSKYTDELAKLTNGEQPSLVSTDSTVEDPSAFALEKHLEDFLVANWAQTELAQDFDIYQEDGEILGQQFPSDTGPIDILALSKDKATLLVIELKKGRASDAVVGQIQRYMGYVQEELAETNQKVRGVIIALDDDLRIRRALSVTQGIEFMTYRISFTLQKR